MQDKHVGHMEVVRVTGNGGLRSYQVPSTNGPPKVCHFSEVDMALHAQAWRVPMRFGCQPGVGDMRSFGDASEMQGDASCYMCMRMKRPGVLQGCMVVYCIGLDNCGLTRDSGTSNRRS